MIRETFPVGPLQCNCTLLGDEQTHEAVVIDPGDDIPRILARLAHHTLTLRQILITHAHIDHIAGAQMLKLATGAPILYNHHDLQMVAIMDEQAGWLGIATPAVLPPDADLAHGMMVGVAGIAAQVLHTPGHTPGSVCLHLPEYSLLFAGDTLFAGTVGRTDLPGGNGKMLITSIHEHLLPLPDTTEVIAGHGRSTTIAAERRSNAFLQ